MTHKKGRVDLGGDLICGLVLVKFKEQRGLLFCNQHIPKDINNPNSDSKTNKPLILCILNKITELLKAVIVQMKKQDKLLVNKQTRGYKICGSKTISKLTKPVVCEDCLPVHIQILILNTK